MIKKIKITTLKYKQTGAAMNIFQTKFAEIGDNFREILINEKHSSEEEKEVE